MDCALRCCHALPYTVSPFCVPSDVLRSAIFTWQKPDDILIYSDSSGTPGEEEESESEEDQQKVSFNVPDILRHCGFLLLLLLLLLNKCVFVVKWKRQLCVAGGLTCGPLRFYVRMTQGPCTRLPSAFILVRAWSKDKVPLDCCEHVFHQIFTSDSVG